MFFFSLVTSTNRYIVNEEVGKRKEWVDGPLQFNYTVQTHLDYVGSMAVTEISGQGHSTVVVGLPSRHRPLVQSTTK